MTERQRHAPKEGPIEQTPEWFAERRNHIGASDAAAACGRSAYRTPLDLYLRMTDGVPDLPVDPASERRMRRGRRLQTVILQEYATEQNVELVENDKMFVHPVFSFCSATPDGIIPSLQKLVESKASSPHMFSLAHTDAKYGEEGSDWVPDDVLFQAQQQMAVMDMDACDVVVMFGVFLMRVYPIPRNDDLIAGIIEAEKELMQRIADRNPPEPEWTHPRTKQLIQAVNGLEPGTVINLSLEDANEWLEYCKLGEQIKHLETMRDASRNKLLWRLGSAELGRFPYGDKELRRVVVTESIFTEADVVEVQKKVGQVKRRRYERLLERKVK